MSVNAKMTAIADEIRAKTGGTEPLSLDDMAENVPKVYESGQENIKAQVEPINAELEKCLAGETVEGKTWYDTFWDMYQDNGNRTDYKNAFYGNFWFRDTSGVNQPFKPKKDLKPKDASAMFSLWNNGSKVNLKEYLDSLGVKLDFSECTHMESCFNTNTSITALGIVDARKVIRMNNCFYWMTYLESIEEFMPPTDKTAWTNQVFQNCDRLQHIVVNGEFVTNGWNFQWSTLLSHDSIVSVMNALSTTTTGLTVTLSSAAVISAFDGIDSAEWKALVATKPNWTISLI